MMPNRPNIVYIMSDDHAAHAMSCYGSAINQTPNLDRIAAGGMRLDTCLCTNAICTPSRANILTGQYSHRTGVETLDDKLDNTRHTVVSTLLQQAGYQTAMIGKWHLGHGAPYDPVGFDYWNVLPGQGLYHNPEMIEMGERKAIQGYATDLITDFSLDWLRRRDPSQPFFLMVHHKAPHRPWDPDEKHAHMYDDVDIPEPVTFDDDYSNRAHAAAAAQMRVDRDLNDRDTKGPPPEGLSPAQVKRWKYQRYIKDYLRCVASIDDNVGRLLDYLDAEGLSENTVVIYTSDQGFFLGDHNWYDKRFFYEESLRMPFAVRYPREIAAGSVDTRIVLNTDFAPLFLDYANAPVPDYMQGRSFRGLLRGQAPSDWKTSMYYRYFMHLSGHNVYAHYGIRTERYKLIYYYKDDPGPREWELFDLDQDPHELNNVYGHNDYQDIVRGLKVELKRLREALDDTTESWEQHEAA